MLLLVLLIGVGTADTICNQSQNQGSELTDQGLETVCNQLHGSETEHGPVGRKKTALVTGGAGFIAHSVIENLLETTDWNIICLNRLHFSERKNRLDDVLNEKDEATKQRVQIIFGDLRAAINPQVAMDIGQVEFILHIAANANGDRAYDDPTGFLWDNVVGTVNILEFARLHQKNLDRFIYISTAEVYGPAPEGVEYKEYDRYNSRNPYAASKAAADEMAVSYENTYKMPIVVTYVMNVFGDRQPAQKYLPAVFNAVREEREVTIHSDPTGTNAGSRRYIHVKDIADGIRFILSLPKEYKHKGEFGGAKCPKFHLVGQEEIDNLSLAKIIAESMGKKLKYKMVDFNKSRSGHDMRFATSGDLLKSLGWVPKVNLRQRVEEFTKWMIENPEWIK